ncbi:MAG TPA: hypothetical protein PLS71_23830, partial [Leptospiraceae bacterium]|nr:hypothetical protein [Leptospiraceae bacterium]
LEENKDSILILYKDKKYKIPRSEILSVDPDVLGPHSSYKNTMVQLEDGSSTKGLFIEETKEILTIKKENNLIAIPRSKILQIQKGEANQSLPQEYQVLEQDKKENTWTIGVSATGFRNGRVVGDVHRESFGFGFYVEPPFSLFNKLIQFGFQSEYFSTGGKLSYSFFQNMGYVLFTPNLFGYNLYFKIGGGTSYVILSEGSASASVLKPVATIEGGIQNVFLERYIWRIGIRENGVYSHREFLDMFGIQLSVGYRF